jgi:hypothetical protein
LHSRPTAKGARRNFRDEDELWEHIAPRLRGIWHRLEVITPDGLTDCLGLWNLATWWCELKVGKPGLKKLRPSQRQFGYDCMRQGVPIYTCFGYKGEALFFLDFDFKTPVQPPWLVLDVG